MKDILVVFRSPELFDDISGIMDHGSDFLWLRWRTQFLDLHFLFVLKRDKKIPQIIKQMVTSHKCFFLF